MTLYNIRQTLVPTISTQGDTGTPSIVKIEAKQDGRHLAEAFGVRVAVCNAGTRDDATNATIAATSTLAELLTSHTANKDLTLLTPRDVYGTQTLTISGVVINGETATIGTRVYEFDTSGSVTSGNVQVDISGGATASQGTLTIAEPVTAGDVIQIGDKTYVFVANGTGDTNGEIDLGADEAATKVNIVAAINGEDAYNTANVDVSASAFSGDVSTLTALVPGTAGNALVTAEVGQGLTHASNVFDATTLGTETAGVDCIAATAVTALVAAITADTSAVVTAIDGAGDTVVVTASTAGAAGNVASTETMANGAWGAATLTGGIDEALGYIYVSVTNATAETVRLYFGSPDIMGLATDYHGLYLDVTHAAP